jgi:hypothetical protein
MLSSDLSPVSLGTGIPIDGILGSDVLKRSIVRIDYSLGSAQFGADVTIPIGGTAVSFNPSTDSTLFRSQCRESQ